MNSAKLYISTDVVDRLTRPIINTTNNNNTLSHTNEDSFMLQQRFDNQSPTQVIRNNNNATTNNRGSNNSGTNVMDMQSFIGSLHPTRNKSRDNPRGQSPQIRYNYNYIYNYILHTKYIF